MVLKRDLTPLTRRGKIVKQKNKGGAPPGAESARNMAGSARGGFPTSINDYAKATPMANPVPRLDTDRDGM